MVSSINFKWCIEVAILNYLLEIYRKKARNGSELLVLMDVSTFVGDQLG